MGAGLGVLVVCVTGALTWRSMNSSHSDGTVPTILADKAPLKIAPQKADGVEIPDQNKRIYDRNAKDDQIHIVNREEQPVDVAQAARSAQRAGEGGAHAVHRAAGRQYGSPHRNPRRASPGADRVGEAGYASAAASARSARRPIGDPHHDPSG